MQVHLRPRLRAAAAFAAGAKTAADIGCDHGRLAVALLQRGIAARVIASDISADSLAKARLLAQRCGIEDARITFAQSDGLSHLASGEADTLVLAGMGGELIARLLAKDKDIAHGAKRIIMQPMGGTLELRRFLLQSGYAIEDERLVLDAKRYYQVILAKPDLGQSTVIPTDALLEFGPVAFAKRDPLMGAALTRCRDGRLRRMEKAQKNGSIPPQLAHELQGVQQLLDILEQEETGK